MSLGTLDRTAPPLFHQGPSPLSKLLFFSALAVFLMVADSRFHLLNPLRIGIVTAMAPVRAAVTSPISLIKSVQSHMHSQQTLLAERNAAQKQVSELGLQANQAKLLQEENQALRNLLQLRSARWPQGIAAEVLYDAADPYSRKVIIDKGQLDNVKEGSTVMDERGVLGQVTRTYLRSSEVSLLISQDYNIPVRNARTGMRSIAYGVPTVANGRLELRHIAASADIQPGDVLATSGVDGMYPAGVDVALVEKIEKRTDSAFIRVYCKPMSQMNSRHLLLLAPVGLDLPADDLLKARLLKPIDASKQPASAAEGAKP